jgi:hypothetical protein
MRKETDRTASTGALRELDLLNEYERPAVDVGALPIN